MRKLTADSVIFPKNYPLTGADTALNLTGAKSENVIVALRCIISHSWHLKL